MKPKSTIFFVGSALNKLLLIERIRIQIKSIRSQFLYTFFVT